MTEQDEIRELRRRILALEYETRAFSAIVFGLASVLGPDFLQSAAEIAEAVEADPEFGGGQQKRMTEALRIIEQIRAGSRCKPKSGEII
ncbi:hypothetical protein ACLBX9_18775 [Methylobacterium sp. A49B]